jgi:protein-tyrosine phosphatase/nicotinamidase-related amidase
VARALLLTECLQNDFVAPVGPHDPLPNALHVGHDEARRLLGPEPRSGPVGRFMSWAHDQVTKGLGVIHVRDWHDVHDPLQQGHLRQFGEHCLAGTAGAGFVFPAPSLPGLSIVDATTLNDFHDTRLAHELAPYAGAQKLRVGIVGVWTEAKVSFLAYELRTRYPDFELAVCGALCASSSRAEHHHALEQLARVLAVEVFASVGEFSDWLAQDRLELPLPGLVEGRPRLLLEDRAVDEATLGAEEQSLVRYLFRDCQKVELDVLDGGFSGNRVLGAIGTDLDGHRQVPHVVKIGPQDSIGRERAHFERVESVLGNSAPRITDFADFGRKGALKYRYASMGGGFSTTFQKQYRSGQPLEQLTRVLHVVFEEQLGRLYAAARRERCNLLDHYGFSPKWTESVRDRVVELTGAPPAEDGLWFPTSSRADGSPDPNGPRIALYDLVRFYGERLGQFPADQREGAYFSFVHGDLNGANIIVDGQQNVWLIDFFHTRRAHVLSDLIKLENDVLYIMTELAEDTALAQAMRFTDALLEVSDLGTPLPSETPVSGVEFERAWGTLRVLRGFYPGLIGSDRSVLQSWIGLLRYAVHTLSFDEPTRRQRRWALYAACRLAEKVDATYRSTDRLRVSWLPGRHTATGRVGLTLLPGRRDQHRDLSRDLDVLEFERTSHVLCLISDDEMHDYGVPGLVEAYRQRGLEVYRLPIRDQGVSAVEEMQRAVAWMREAVARGGSVVVHCVGGLGRSGLAAAAFLREQGLSAHEAIRLVREARSPRALETPVQEQFVEDYPAG